MKKKIILNFITPTKETEIGRLLFTAYKIATLQYQKHDFLVLPSLPSTPLAQAVIFPNLPYAQIPNFWHKDSGIN